MKLVHLICLAAALGAVLLVVPKASAQDGPRLVAKILKVTFNEDQKDPANLVVTATGQVNTGGYSKARLLRTVYATPPEDGIQDYFLMAVPPDGIAAQVISKVEASNSWKAYQKEAPWIKGIRIHGIDGGVKVKMIK